MLFMIPLASCHSSNPSTTPNPSPLSSTQGLVNPVTVTYRYGDEVLKTEEIESGTVLSADHYVPESQDGKSFNKWYATPNLAFEFDFTRPITADTIIFAGFSSAFQKDERTWMILGSGKSPVLLTNEWGKEANHDPSWDLVRADKDNVNEFTITNDFYAGDAFQFAIDFNWGNQRGAGYMKTTQGEDGTDYFQASGGLGDNGPKKTNIKVLVSGNYTFTLTTYPGDDYVDTNATGYNPENPLAFTFSNYDTISWKFNNAIEDNIETVIDYYIKGEKITNWQDVYFDEAKMTPDTDRKIYTITKPLDVDDNFMFTSMQTVGEVSGVGTSYIKSENLADDAATLAALEDNHGNIKTKVKGLYTLTYNAETAKLSATVDETKFIEAVDCYLKGTNNSWADFDADLKFVTNATNANVLELKNVALPVDAEFGLATWVVGTTEATKNEGRLSFLGIKYLAKAADTNANANFEAKGSNFLCKTAGNYDVSIDLYSNLVTFTLVA